MLCSPAQMSSRKEIFATQADWTQKKHSSKALFIVFRGWLTILHSLCLGDIPHINIGKLILSFLHFHYHTVKLFFYIVLVVDEHIEKHEPREHYQRKYLQYCRSRPRLQLRWTHLVLFKVFSWKGEFWMKSPHFDFQFVDPATQ